MAGQLHLFKSNRQRGTSPPPAPEFKLHCMVADVLRRWALPGWIWTHFPAGEERASRTNANGKRYSSSGSRLKRMGLQKGWPDFQFVCIDGRCCFLELKRRGMRLDEDQLEIANHLQRAGCGYLCTDRFDEAVAQLVTWKIVRGLTVQ